MISTIFNIRSIFLFILILQDIANYIVIFGKGRKIVVAAACNAHQRYFLWIELLKLLTVSYRYQPIFCTMQYVSVTVYMNDPFVCSQMITQ